jgi:aminoglycoside phosphotransferase (APT) family kinase protein
MENKIVKTTVLEGGFGGNAKLIEMSDGQKFVYKSYAHLLPSTSLINEEWDTLVYLYNKGCSVPKPIEKDETGYSMQYIDSGNFISIYKKADIVTQKEMMSKFAKVLYDLHKIETTEKNVYGEKGFLQNELAEIRQVVEDFHFDEYIEILDRLETVSSNVIEKPLCYIHRDYHAWNVLSDKEGKLYIIDLFLKQGDFRFDVGWAYMLMSRNGENEGFGESFLAEYEKINPDVIVNIEFFKQLANLRWLINVKPGQLDKANAGWQWLINQGEKMIDVNFTL